MQPNYSLQAKQGLKSAKKADEKEATQAKLKKAASQGKDVKPQMGMVKKDKMKSGGKVKTKPKGYAKGGMMQTSSGTPMKGGMSKNPKGPAASFKGKQK
jgi:hypothetical protein